MTIKPDPVVEALECAAELECTDSVRVLGICVPCAAQDALPLAREQAEAKVALEWLIKALHDSGFNFSGIKIDVWFAHKEDCPAIIKRYLEGK